MKNDSQYWLRIRYALSILHQKQGTRNTFLQALHMMNIKTRFINDCNYIQEIFFTHPYVPSEYLIIGKKIRDITEALLKDVKMKSYIRDDLIDLLVPFRYVMVFLHRCQKEHNSPE
uniref:Uncharacterized protein n=1 Tax=Sphaerodactylus townsendi TaxID=933632 RepID=A0ACB8FUD5_9SAUR